MTADPRRLPWLVLRASRAGGGRAGGVLSIWNGWERLTLRLYRVTPVRPGGLLVYRRRRHRGAPATLEDGIVVADGAPIVELHLDNRALAAARDQPGYSTWTAVRTLRLDVGALAAADLERAVAIHGVSLLGAVGGRLGFEARLLPRGPRAALLRYFMAGIDAVYHPDGLQRLDGKARERWPVEVWMSMRRLRRLYGTPDR